MTDAPDPATIVALSKKICLSPAIAVNFISQLKTWMLCAVLVSGCTTTPAPTTHRVPLPQPPASAPAYEPYTEVDRLLDGALDAIDQLKLTTPPGDNAYDRFLQVLALEPANPEALQGLETIVHTYLDLGTEVLQRGDVGSARSYLARAESVIPGHTAVEELRRRLNTLESAEQRSVPLDPEALRERTRATRNQLMTLGVRAKNARTRVVIVARNDAEGRWIYQQMNAAPGQRLRSELRIGATPQVTLQQLGER